MRQISDSVTIPINMYAVGTLTRVTTSHEPSLTQVDICDIFPNNFHSSNRDGVI
jgi:hypothetical protein